MSEYRAIQCRDEEHWLEERNNGIGASEMAQILGASPWGGPFEVYCRKLGIADPIETTEPMEWGHRLEPAIAKKFEDESGWHVSDPGDYTIYVSERWPFMFATLDRWVVADDVRRPLELKAVGASKAEEWENGAPDHYRVQCQHQMAVTGTDRAYIAALIGGQRFVWDEIDRDQAFIDHMVNEADAFWQRVKNADPPEPDDNLRTGKLLERMYPHDSGEIIELPGSLIEMDRERQEVLAQITELEARRRFLDNHIKQAIGDATKGVLPNGVAYSWKEQTRAEHVVKASSFRVLRRSEKK